ncbi:methyltransferase domain-containing protein [Sneathiella chungangensis]|uniref:Methyltransferase domain-containing protein n=1 Tax=Sneathiella chungangensis TaxID=1418234 RepID=A0A845MHY3_9PROT|nr:rRNA adenine N-6-methyltransferase family protein [Sneathiella chungangensis]MZR22877.1 methyltransferase domain-containing protein [Sneathiella chungangensis]
MYQSFVLALLRNPRQIGALAPSGQPLARAMARAVDLAGKRILEIGPGTGAITEALLASGASRKHLCLLERDNRLAKYLAVKFPDIRVITGDARAVSGLIEVNSEGAIDIVFSSLPLLNMNTADRISILEQIVALLDERGTLIQYTYSARAPFSDEMTSRFGLKGERATTVFRNLPPASVWKYSRTIN